MSDITAGRWESLRQRRTPHDFIAEPVTAAFEDCLIGISTDGRLHFLVGVAVEPPSLPPDLQGIEVRLVETQRTWLDVSAKSHHEQLLTMLANEILYAIRVEGREPAVAVERTLEDIRAALRPVTLDLGVGEQIGLFGELWVLSNVLFPTLGAHGCHCWSGPLGERHDFVGRGVHLEVKTTTRLEERHEIARLDQLRAPEGKRLLLASVLLERSLAGDETLADLVDEIVGKLGNDGRAIDVFDTNLKKLGWHDELRQTGSLLRFNVRDVHVFEVAGSFPRLPDDFVVARGVSAVRYTIDVAALPFLSKAIVGEILNLM